MIKINNIKSSGMDLTPSIRGYVEEKLGMLEKFVNENDTSISVDVEVERTTKHHNQGDIFRAELNFHIGGKIFRAESSTEDLYASIDKVKDEIARALKDEKEKHRDKKRKGGAFIKQLLRGFKN